MDAIERLALDLVEDMRADGRPREIVPGNGYLTAADLARLCDLIRQQLPGACISWHIHREMAPRLQAIVRARTGGRLLGQRTLTEVGEHYR